MASAHEHDPPVSALTLEEQEAVVAERLGPDAHLIQLFRFGLDMEEFVNADERGRYLVQRANDDLEVAVKALLDTHDLQSDDARKAHFDARVALNLLRYIQEAIDTGKESERQIIGMDEVSGDT